MSSTTKLSARDRIVTLLDDSSFVEIGALVTKRNTDFNLAQTDAPSDGVITGYGLIDGSLVYVYSQDAEVLNGTMGEMHAKKIESMYDLALKVGAPVIGLVDCAGMRLQEATDALAGFGNVYLKQSMASGVIPQIIAVFGTCGGGCAVSAAMSDFTFMPEEGAKLFVNSPNAVEDNFVGKCDTSAAKFQAEAGVVDVVREDEVQVLASIRKLVSYLPSNNETDCTIDCTDDLNRATAAFAEETADPAVALADIADNGEFFEIKAEYAKEMVTGFIRLNGATIGAVANRTAVFDENGKTSEKFDAVLTTKGCYKAESFVEFCDAFGIPVLTLTNVTGYAATMSEEKSVAIAAAKLTNAFANATVPKVNVVCKEALGSAYITMNSKHIGADMVFALEDAKIGMMDAKLAAQIMYAGESEEVRNEKAAEYDAMQSSAVSAAKRGYVDSIISADAVRQQLVYTFEMLYTKREARPSKKHGTV
ncbi:MAG: carboxyl transferase domain-containing protein [Lachnospiraceae bacterium]|nr:carboxyl transferase domain-containing protein [Lachnospiraceae bacterium]